jgi:hypothetical protein
MVHANVARTRNGFTPSLRQQLFRRFRGLEIATCPFANLPEAHGGRWGQGCRSVVVISVSVSVRSALPLSSRALRAFAIRPNTFTPAGATTRPPRLSHDPGSIDKALLEISLGQGASLRWELSQVVVSSFQTASGQMILRPPIKYHFPLPK